MTNLRDIILSELSTNRPTHISKICTNVSLREKAECLVLLEMAGKVKQLGGDNYILL